MYAHINIYIYINVNIYESSPTIFHVCVYDIFFNVVCFYYVHMYTYINKKFVVFVCMKVCIHIYVYICLHTCMCEYIYVHSTSS